MTTKSQLVASFVFLVGISVSSFAGVTAPRLVEQSAPEYPTAARTQHLEGTVLVELVVSEDGTVVAADVVKSVSKELDKAALASASTWKFEPATQDGKAIKQVVRVPITFDLVAPNHDHLDPADTSNLANK